MDTRQKEKEKDKEKEMAPGERTPKDLTWIVVKLRNHEDSGLGKMCAAGASGQAVADGTNPARVLPAQTGVVNNEMGEPEVPIILTEVQVDDVDNQQELRD
ncbi:hypothetical protein DY000_02031483 [Brassica cretica]|uniref:Uncharacterized protein n=1 Tax=Brassica cretica TaxID=69181 RepID=A0ABQ7DPN4_BRACR|nr:hypothetical protein DY000_02031483 [Brassica cretica]